MRRIGEIILKENLFVGKTYELKGENHKNLLLWDIRAGEAITVSDSSTKLFRARLNELKEDSAIVYVFEDTGFIKDELSITLIQALPDKARMELIIQKTTELGVDRIIPIKTERAITLAEWKEKHKKAEQWTDVALKAAKQSRSAAIPEILSYMSFEETLSAVKESDLKIVFYECRGTMNLKEVLKRKNGVKTITILVGPEGGFTEQEIANAGKNGFKAVSFGSRILRTETAAIAGIGIVRYELGLA